MSDAAMSIDTIEEPAPTGQNDSIFSWIRLVAAWLLTLVVLPYGAGYVIVFLISIQRFPKSMTALTLTALLAVVLLTWELGTGPRFHPYRRMILAWVAVSWIVTSGLIGWVALSESTVREYFVPMFILASLPVPWLAWIKFAPASWSFRIGGLAVLLVGLLAFFLGVRVDGIEGDNRVQMAWKVSPTAIQRAMAIPAPTAALSPSQIVLRSNPDDFPEYLGPNRTGVLSCPSLSADWSKTPPKLVWKQPVGLGWGSFAVVGDFAFTQEQRQTDELVVCYEKKTGHQIWTHVDHDWLQHSMGGPGPRCTPTVKDGRVYALGSTGLLHCLEGKTGKPVWSVNILKDAGTTNLPHGMCGSPLVLNDRVYVCPSSDQSLVAYDANTGERVLSVGEDVASYSSPMLVTLSGVPQVLVFGQLAVSAYSPESGNRLWDFRWSNGERTNCSQPIVVSNDPPQVLVSTGYGGGAALIHLTPRPSGSWEVTPGWQNKRLKAKFMTPVLYKGHVYGLDDGIMTCLDVKDGRALWKKGRYGHGQILLVNDLLLVQTEPGEVVLVQPNPERLNELGRFKPLTDKTWNTLALSGPYLFCRNDKEAACYELPLAK